MAMKSEKCSYMRCWISKPLVSMQLILQSMDTSVTLDLKLFTAQVMAPLFATTQAFVLNLLQERKETLAELFGPGAALPANLLQDTVPKLFWFLVLQTQLPQLVQALTDEQIAWMVRSSGGMLDTVCAQMVEDGKAGLISDHPNDLRIPSLMRALLLLLFTHAALSDPNCYLQPAPGTRLVYHPDRCKKIFIPCCGRYGRIREGDEVEVVLCGLYFEDAEGMGTLASTRPVAPCLVRRLLPVV